MSQAFVHSLAVRYNECDPQGIVFFGNYATYIDVAHTAMWEDRLGSYPAFVAQTRTDIVVAELRLRYQSSARYGDVVEIELRPALTSASSLTTALTMRCSERVVVEGEIRHVCVDASSLEKRPAPDAVRHAFGAADAISTPAWGSKPAGGDTI